MAKSPKHTENATLTPTPGEDLAPGSGEAKFGGGLDAETRFTTTVFLNAVVPLLKPIVAERPELRRAFRGKEGVVQISALAPAQAGGISVDGRETRLATHLTVANRTWDPTRHRTWKLSSLRHKNSMISLKER